MLLISILQIIVKWNCCCNYKNILNIYEEIYISKQYKFPRNDINLLIHDAKGFAITLTSVCISVCDIVVPEWEDQFECGFNKSNACEIGCFLDFGANSSLLSSRLVTPSQKATFCRDVYFYVIVISNDPGFWWRIDKLPNC